MSSFIPFPILRTKRLQLRRLQKKDDENLFRMFADPAHSKYIDRPLCESLDEARNFILRINKGTDEGKWIYWAISIRENSDLIGSICLWNFSEDRLEAETGFELMPYYQNNGFMQEALPVVVHYACNALLIDTLHAVVQLDNEKSIRLLKRNDFRRQNVLKNNNSVKKEEFHMALYTYVNN